MTIYDELADQIFAEVSAVLGPLHSTHLGRKLDAGDIHDAVILATDMPGGEPDRAALLIAAAPGLLTALRAIVDRINGGYSGTDKIAAIAYAAIQQATGV